MDEEKKDEATGAQLQIERLMKMKLEREKREKLRAESAGLAGMPEPEPVTETAGPEEPVAAAVAAGARTVKKQPNMIKVEKRLYEKLHRITFSVNAQGGPKLTKAKFVNLVLKEFIALGLDYNVVKDQAALKKLFERLKTGD